MNTAAKIKMVSDLIGHVNTNYNTDEILSVFKNLADYTVEDSTAYPQVFYGGKVDGAWVECLLHLQTWLQECISSLKVRQAILLVQL